MLLSWALAIMLEVTAIFYLVQHNSLFFYGLHGAGCVIIAFAIFKTLPKSWNPTPKHLLLSISPFCFFIPGLGMFALLLLTISRFFQKEISLVQTINFVSQPSMVVQGVLGTQFGVGGATARLISERTSVQKRTEALLALSVLHTAEKNALMREILNDDTDQIRLLAFSLLDQQEKKITARITVLRDRYIQTSNKTSRGRIAFQLAEQYWELIYKDLVQGDLRKTVLQLALEYANTAWTIQDGEVQLAILLSKCHLANQDIASAEIVLNSARRKGAKSTQVLPYIAAIHFLNRDFANLRLALNENPYLKDVPKLNSIVEFWCKQS